MGGLVGGLVGGWVGGWVVVVVVVVVFVGFARTDWLTFCDFLLGFRISQLPWVLVLAFFGRLILPFHFPLFPILVPSCKPGLLRQRGPVSFVLRTLSGGDRYPAAGGVQTCTGGKAG